MSTQEFILTWLTNPIIMMILVIGLLYVLSRVMEKENIEEIQLPTLKYLNQPVNHQADIQQEESTYIPGNDEGLGSETQVDEQNPNEATTPENEIDLDSLSLQDRLMYVSHKKQQEDLSNKEREMAEKEEAFDIKQQKDDLEREKERHELEKQKDAIFNESQDAEMERRRAEQKLKEADFRNKQADAKEREAKRKLDAYNNGRYW